MGTEKWKYTAHWDEVKLVEIIQIISTEWCLQPLLIWMRSAIVNKNEDMTVRVVSEGYDMIVIDANDVEKVDKEEGTSIGLIRGVLAGLKERGYKIGGFNAYVTSDVLIGAGLSSSAAFENNHWNHCFRTLQRYARSAW